jgi:hypothetical protein
MALRTLILARYLHVFAGMAAANDPIRKCKGYRKLLRALTKKRIHLPSVTDLREGTKISAIRVGVGRRPNHVCVVLEKPHVKRLSYVR